MLDELTNGPPERSAVWLELIRDLPLLPIELAIAEIVETYMRHRLMPAAPGDALHLALASHPLRDGGGEELVALDLRLALDDLGKVVGAVVTDDILDRICQRFCIGK